MTRARWSRLFVLAAAVLGAMAIFAPSASATHGQPGKGLPFRGFVQGFVTVRFAPAFPFLRDTFGGRCSVPSDWIAEWSGTGESTLTGKITAFGSDCDRINLATLDLVYGDGTITEFGANGDYLYGTYTNGHGRLGGVIADDWTIVGGTGRFTGATGEGVETFNLLAPPSFSGAPLPFINPWDGVLSFDSSNRSAG